MLFRRTLLSFGLLACWPCSAVAQPAHADQRFIIVLMGPTGSGKTTQAEFLQKKFGIPTISADELIRRNPDALAKYKTPGINAGPPQESDALNQLIKARLAKMDFAKGVALDGYPATKDQADHLQALVKELHLTHVVVIQLDVPDAVDRARLAKRKTPEDQPAMIAQRLKDYHRELDMVHAYYPQQDIWTIDGTKPVAEVSATIASILNDELPKHPVKH